jgi:hypothetical protein
MEQMQKAYETIRAHLIKQGRPALDRRTGSCFYRHKGLKCAVGCLISDDAYDEFLEDATPLNVSVQQALRASGWDLTIGGFSMLREMQVSHDYWRHGDDAEHVISRIDGVAQTYGLEVVK